MRPSTIMPIGRLEHPAPPFNPTLEVTRMKFRLAPTVAATVAALALTGLGASAAQAAIPAPIAVPPSPSVSVYPGTRTVAPRLAPAPNGNDMCAKGAYSVGYATTVVGNPVPARITVAACRAYNGSLTVNDIVQVDSVHQVTYSRHTVGTNPDGTLRIAVQASVVRRGLEQYGTSTVTAAFNAVKLYG